MLRYRAFVGLSEVNENSFMRMCAAFRPRQRHLSPVEVSLLRSPEFSAYACNVMRPMTNWFVFPLNAEVPATVKLVIEVMAFNNFAELAIETVNVPSLDGAHNANVHLIRSLIAGTDVENRGVIVPLNLEKSNYNHVYPLPHELAVQRQQSRQLQIQLMQQQMRLQQYHTEIQELLFQQQEQLLRYQQQLLVVGGALMAGGGGPNAARAQLQLQLAPQQQQQPYVDPYAPRRLRTPPRRRRSVTPHSPRAPRQSLVVGGGGGADADADADAGWMAAADALAASEAAAGVSDFSDSDTEVRRRAEREQEDVAADAVETEHRLEGLLGLQARRARKRLVGRPPSSVLDRYGGDAGLEALENELMGKYAPSCGGCNDVWDVLGPGAFSIFSVARADPVFRLKKSNEYIVKQLSQDEKCGSVLSAMDHRKAGDPISLEEEFRKSATCVDMAYKVLTGRQVAMNVCSAVQRRRESAAAAAVVACDTCFVCQESLDVALYTTLTVCGHGVHVCCWLEALSNEVAQNQHPEHAPTLTHMNIDGRDISATPRLPFTHCPVCRSLVVGVNVTDLVSDDERFALPYALPGDDDVALKVCAYRYLKKKQLRRTQSNRNRLGLYLKGKKEAYDSYIAGRVWNHDAKRWVVHVSGGCKCHPELCPAKSEDAAAAAAAVAAQEFHRRRRGGGGGGRGGRRVRRCGAQQQQQQQQQQLGDGGDNDDGGGESGAENAGDVHNLR